LPEYPVGAGAEKGSGTERLARGETNRKIKMIHSGIVSKYCEVRQYGYIQDKDGVEIFFHRANCVRGFVPELGVAVEYKIGKPFRLGKPDQAVEVNGVQK
jgi:hypothetical protein